MFMRKGTFSRGAFKSFFLLAVLAASSAGHCFAQAVTTCNALTMYGWGVTDGTFKHISPTTQTHWVGEISLGNPEIHVTFSAGTPLHLTVRAGTTCMGNVNLHGTFPGAIIAPGAPAQICGVTIATYLARLNAIAQGPTPGGQTACRAGFLAAPANRLSPATQATYLNTCNAPPACP
jgi:hypothetical protein